MNYLPESAAPTVVGQGSTAPQTVEVNAIQTTDLAWNGIFGDNTQICQISTKSGEETVTVKGEKGCLLPVNVPGSYSENTPQCLIYDGQHHSIKGIKVNVTGTASAGLFGDLPNDSSVKDLALIDFNVTSVSGSAGALAGTLTQNGDLPQDKTDKANPKDIPNVSNVIAYNTQQYDAAKARAATITATNNASGDVGGLIGKVIGGQDKDHKPLACTAWIEKSAAALVVKSTGGNAGGLIGTMESGTLTGCYSGGHTVDKKDGTTVIGVVYDDTAYNVTGVTAVGGLIGDAGNTAVSYSYTTCSAIGNKAGGLVGNAGGAINTCYSTGLVSGSDTTPVTGAFAVLADGATATNCKYYQAINELATVKRGTDIMTVQMAKVVTGDVIQSIQYMVPIIMSNGTAASSEIVISAIDESANSYNAFVGDPNGTSGWKAALPYNMTLADYYQVVKASRYSLRTVSELIGLKLADGPQSPEIKEKTGPTDTTTVEDYVATHYGDWPAPEIFVVNEKSTTTPSNP